MTYRREIDELISRLEPELRRAFERAMQDLRDGVDYRALLRALEAGDIDAAMRALNIDKSVFNQYLLTQQLIYMSAGQITARYIVPPLDVPKIRFDMTNPRAEQWIASESSTRIVGYTQEQTQTARRVILEGYADGRGPQDIATDIAGRIDRSTGRRVGGIIGLSDPQSRYVQTVRQALESGDYRSLFVESRATGELRPRFTRMDGRDLRTIKAAMARGKPLTKAQRDKIAARYTDRLLARRAEDVARTETAAAVMSSRQESYRQALEKAGLPMTAVIKTWIHAGADDLHARLQHIAMDGRKVIGLDEEFTLPDGTRMLHAHDPKGGARHVVNCRCDTRYTIDFSVGVT